MKTIINIIGKLVISYFVVILIWMFTIEEARGLFAMLGLLFFWIVIFIFKENEKFGYVEGYDDCLYLRKPKYHRDISGKII